MVRVGMALVEGKSRASAGVSASGTALVAKQHGLNWQRLILRP